MLRPQALALLLLTCRLVKATLTADPECSSSWRAELFDAGECDHDLAAVRYADGFQVPNKQKNCSS